MQDSKTTLRNLLKKIRRTRILTASSMIAEQMVTRVWRILTWVVFFLGLVLLQIPDVWDQKGKVFALFAFFVGLIYFIRKDMRGLALPDAHDIDRRIEAASRLEHRPLNALRDKLANDRKMNSRTLWHAGRHNVIERLKNIRASLPRALISLSDPYALRFGAILIFMLGIASAGPDTGARLVAGFAPFSYDESGAPTNSVRFVIAPPKYTNAKQIIQNGSNREAFNIPAGSIMKATVHGGLGRPSLKVDGVAFPFDDAGDGNYILEMSVPPGKKLKISQSMLPRASFKYELLPDAPPKITMDVDKISTNSGGEIRVPFEVSDDYGVKTMLMHMEYDASHEDSKDKPPIGKPITLSRSVLSPAGKPLEITPLYNLTSHPWAGKPVEITFKGLDHLGQESNIETLQIVLPERNFSSPMAQKIAEVRKKLILEPLENYKVLVHELEVLQTHPDLFRRDNTVLLAMRSAASRLFWSEPSQEIAESVVSLLWETAVTVEDGNLSQAERNLRDAQRALENALQNPDATNEELTELMNNLRLAMAQYLGELHRELQRRAANGGDVPMISGKMMSPDALAELLDQMESNMMSGDRSSAQQMLSQIENMFNLRNLSSDLPEDIKKMVETAFELQKIIKRQEALLDQTTAQKKLQEQTENVNRSFGEALPPDTGLMKNWELNDLPPSPVKSKEKPSEKIVDSRPLQSEQEDIRVSLGAIMIIADETMGQIPQNMAEAETEMRSSSQELWNSQPAIAVPHQEKVLELLQKSQEEMKQALAKRMENIQILSFGAGQTDPLGRPYGNDGKSLDSNVKIPDESEKKRAQEIQRLLQKRAGEIDRPATELEYYRRLLQRF